MEKRFDARIPAIRTSPTASGWVVDDPQVHSAPLKHTAMGRFKHEGANVRVGDDGTVVAYSGDDEKFEYIYKFISAKGPRGQQRAQHDPPVRGQPLRGHWAAQEQITGGGTCPGTASLTAPASVGCPLVRAASP
ncbi:DUF839 domain-containing protein [Kocuria rhizophila]|nr:DUF839 domain-containing protein [Kocuria rhizophila]